jgi:phosphoglycolate phosphatase-like HAD superfamily hydrolase
MPLSKNASFGDPLPSWNDGVARAAILDFVATVTKEGATGYIPPEQRIATFDNDGTLWSEKPFPYQIAYALDQIKAISDDHPEWQEMEPFKSALVGDLSSILAGGYKGLMEIVAATHSGITTEEFERSARQWLAVARHPRTGKLYTEMVFQPMLELLAYFRDSGFKTFIVSGGGVDFMRAFTEVTYGVPPEYVIGSGGKMKFELRDGEPVLVKLHEVDVVNDSVEKPGAIQKHIGRRPIASFGNSDGDLEMLQWTVAGKGPRLVMLIHHTDDVREWAYDRNPSIGQLDKALDEAHAKGWTVVDMKTDWRRVFPHE